jgi:hypothetical protein
MDGSLSFRERGKKRERKDYNHSLPVFSVDTVREAMELIMQVGTLTWIGGGPAWQFREGCGAYEDLAKCAAKCREVYTRMKGEKK